MRIQISKRLRFEVFKRDGFTCQYCGEHPPVVVLEADHITPVAEGGGNEIDNLTTACFDCNRGKSSIPLSSIPETLSEKAKRVQEAEAQLKAYHDVMEARLDRLETETWLVAEVLEPGCTKVGFNDRDFMSIKRFIEALGYHEVLGAMEKAVYRKRSSRYASFRYFCGICWNLIRPERMAR